MGERCEKTNEERQAEITSEMGEESDGIEVRQKEVVMTVII